MICLTFGKGLLYYAIENSLSGTETEIGRTLRKQINS